MRRSGKKIRRDDVPVLDRTDTNRRPLKNASDAGRARAHRKLRLITSQALDGRTRASQQFNKIVSSITSDLGGAENVTEIEKHLVTSFAGAAILQGHQLAKLLAGVVIDPHEYSSVTTAMIRSATRLGTDRRARDVTPTLGDMLRDDLRRQQELQP